MPVLLIAEREFRTYVATLSFWLSLAVAPLAAGVAVLLSGGHAQPLPVTIQGADAVLARSVQTAVQEAGRLEGHSFVFKSQGAVLVLARRAPQRLDVTFGDGFPLSPLGRAMVGHHNRSGGGRGDSWNSAHLSRGCSQENLVGTGGNGYFYCFAIN